MCVGKRPTGPGRSPSGEPLLPQGLLQADVKAKALLWPGGWLGGAPGPHLVPTYTGLEGDA